MEIAETQPGAHFPTPATAGLSHRGIERVRRGSAEEFGEECDGGINTFDKTSLRAKLTLILRQCTGDDAMGLAAHFEPFAFMRGRLVLLFFENGATARALEIRSGWVV